MDIWSTGLIGLTDENDRYILGHDTIDPRYLSNIWRQNREIQIGLLKKRKNWDWNWEHHLKVNTSPNISCSRKTGRVSLYRSACALAVWRNSPSQKKGPESTFLDELGLEESMFATSIIELEAENFNFFVWWLNAPSSSARAKESSLSSRSRLVPATWGILAFFDWMICRCRAKRAASNWALWERKSVDPELPSYREGAWVEAISFLVLIVGLAGAGGEIWAWSSSSDEITMGSPCGFLSSGERHLFCLASWMLRAMALWSR